MWWDVQNYPSAWYYEIGGVVFAFWLQPRVVRTQLETNFFFLFFLALFRIHVLVQLLNRSTHRYRFPPSKSLISSIWWVTYDIIYADKVRCLLMPIWTVGQRCPHFSFSTYSTQIPPHTSQHNALQQTPRQCGFPMPCSNGRRTIYILAAAVCNFYPRRKKLHSRRRCDILFKLPGSLFYHQLLQRTWSCDWSGRSCLLLQPRLP